MRVNSFNLSLSECYGILNVPTDSSFEEIRKAYHKKALLTHPDHNPNNPESTKAFQRLNDAFHQLERYYQAKERARVLRQNKQQNFQEKKQEQKRPTNTSQNFQEQKRQQNTSQNFQEKKQEQKRSTRKNNSYDFSWDRYCNEDNSKSRVKNPKYHFTKLSEDKIEKRINEALKVPNAQRVFVYYTEKLKNLYPNEFDEILYQLRFESVYSTPLSGEKKLGHTFIEILLDKLYKSWETPSFKWIDTILQIAGDPRFPEKNNSYHISWDLISDEYRDFFKNWLNIFDIQVYLNAYKMYLKTISDDYPFLYIDYLYDERKNLLYSLLKSNCIDQTILVFGTKAKKAFTSFYTEAYKPKHFDVSGQATFAAIYLKLDDVHMIDGTHNYAIRLMKGTPSNAFFSPSFVANGQKLKRTDISTDLKKAHARQFPKRNYFERKHSGGWKFDFFLALKDFQVPVDINDCIPNEERNNPFSPYI